jgi:hypothetical protein
MRHNNRAHIVCNSSVMLFGGAQQAAQCSYRSIKLATDSLISIGHPEKGNKRKKMERKRMKW